MRLFEVQPDDDWESKYEIDASHKLGLPGVKCSVCGRTWSTTGIAYPSVGSSVLPSDKRYRDVWPVSLDEIEELRRPLIDSFSNGAVLPPGTEFGPLVGMAQGTFGDFVWLNPWTLLIKSEALSSLIHNGVRMPKAVRPILTFGGNGFVDILELQIEPRARLDLTPTQSDSESRCRACGYKLFRKPKELIIERSSIPQDFDLFRAQDFTTLIFATQKFVEAVEDLKLTAVVFHKVAVTE